MSTGRRKSFYVITDTKIKTHRRHHMPDFHYMDGLIWRDEVQGLTYMRLKTTDDRKRDIDPHFEYFVVPTDEVDNPYAWRELTLHPQIVLIKLREMCGSKAHNYWEYLGLEGQEMIPEKYKMIVDKCVREGLVAFINDEQVHAAGDFLTSPQLDPARRFTRIRGERKATGAFRYIVRFENKKVGRGSIAVREKTIKMIFNAIAAAKENRTAIGSIEVNPAIKGGEPVIICPEGSRFRYNEYMHLHPADSSKLDDPMQVGSLQETQYLQMDMAEAAPPIKMIQPPTAAAIPVTATQEEIQTEMSHVSDTAISAIKTLIDQIVEDACASRDTQIADLRMQNHNLNNTIQMLLAKQNDPEAQRRAEEAKAAKAKRRKELEENKKKLEDELKSLSSSDI